MFPSADFISKDEIAEALRVHPKDIDQLVFGLALTSLNGVPRSGDRSRPPAIAQSRPSFRRAALDNTISWVSVSFAMFFSCACDSIGCHQHNPAMARGPAGCGEGRLRRPASDTKQCSGTRRSPAGFGPFDPLCANEHKTTNNLGVRS